MDSETEYTAYFKNQPFVAFDTETTGIWAPVNNLVEIGAVKFTLGEGVIDRFQSLINPGRPMPPDVIAVHGITDVMVENAPIAAEILECFRIFCSDDSILIAHNAPFDLSFLYHEMRRGELTLPDNPVLDTVDIFRRFHPGLWSYSLLNLVRHFGLAQNQEHRAMSDALFVQQLFEIGARSFAEVDSSDQLFQLLTTYRLREYHETNVELPERFSDITVALNTESRLEIEYLSPDKPASKRIVQPRQVIQHGRNLYLIAFCEAVNAERTFRLDRIGELRLIKRG